jgi:hypothetical protein
MSALFFHAGIKVESFDSSFGNSTGVRPFIGTNVAFHNQIFLSGEFSGKQPWERSDQYAIRGTYLFYKKKYGVTVGIQNNGYETRLLIAPAF